MSFNMLECRCNVVLLMGGIYLLSQIKFRIQSHIWVRIMIMEMLQFHLDESIIVCYEVNIECWETKVCMYTSVSCP